MIELDAATEEQFLGRAIRPVLNATTRGTLAGRRVLVTGAGGSIGSELVRQVAACGPALLTLFEQSEYGLFRIESELRERHPGLRVQAVLGDVTRATDVRGAFDEAAPEWVYHTAAYKHVTMAERAVVAAARVNVLGTALVSAAVRRASARLVLVSTDKAAEPISVMGATKRLAEMVVLDGAHVGVRPTIVRFGNVLGSSGSILEVMYRAIAESRPIPLTAPDATRYFMTASEAVSLVLTAGALDGHGDVFWVDMGAPVPIGVLADRVTDWARRHGHTPAGVRVIGLRAGEKLDEQLTSQGLEMRPSPHPHVWVARQMATDAAVLRDALRRVRRGVARARASEVLGALEAAVPDFRLAGSTRMAAHRSADVRWQEAA